MVLMVVSYRIIQWDALCRVNCCTSHPYTHAHRRTHLHNRSVWNSRMTAPKYFQPENPIKFSSQNKWEIIFQNNSWIMSLKVISYKNMMPSGILFNFLFEFPASKQGGWLCVCVQRQFIIVGITQSRRFGIPLADRLSQFGVFWMDGWQNWVELVSSESLTECDAFENHR